MRGAPPLRFVALVVGLWVCVRSTVLMPGWSQGVEQIGRPGAKDGAATRTVAREARRIQALAEAAGRETASPAGSDLAHVPDRVAVPLPKPRARRPVPLARSELVLASAPPSAPFPTFPMLLPLQPEILPPAEPMRAASPAFRSLSRWSGSAWGFVRRGKGPQLAAGGTLGGSQIGARIGYRLNSDGVRPLSFSARIYSPMGSASGAEGAVGFEWKPSAAVPITVLAERRQAIGRHGRSAFSLTGFGGVSDRKVAGPLVIDAYAQAGLVGLKSRDLFVDGSAALGLPVGGHDELKVGAALWAAAQPGVSRVDAGPQVSYQLPLQGKAVRVIADWRVRVAGDAAPGSGPALTLSTAF